MGEADSKDEYNDGSFYFDWKLDGFHFYLSYLNPENNPNEYRIDIK